MPFLVAADTGKPSVPGMILGQKSINPVMAGTAVFCGYIFSVSNFKRHMGLMTLPATISSHIIRVGQMAVLTGLNLAVEFVAGSAVKLAVHAGIGS